MFSNKYYLFIQLGSYQADSNVLDLLKFSFKEILPEQHNLSYGIWNQGKTKRRRYKDFDRFQSSVAKLKNETFNTLDIRIKISPYFNSEYDIELQSVDCFFLVSPKNTLWGNVYGYLLDSRSAESKRSWLESKERSLRYNEITKYPSLYAIVVEMKSRSERKELIRSCAKIISKGIGEELENIHFGCADLMERTPTLNLLDDLAPYRKTCQHLDDKFDDIHDILIGNNRLCSALNLHLKSAFPNIETKKITNKLGIVCFPERDETLSSELLEFMVRKDHSTESRKPDAGKGEHLVRGRLLTTYKRHKELFEKKMIPTYDPDEISYSPVIHKNYLSGIDVKLDDVFVCSGEKNNFEKFYHSCPVYFLIKSASYNSSFLKIVKL